MMKLQENSKTVVVFNNLCFPEVNLPSDKIEAEVSEGYWGSNIIIFPMVSIALLRQAQVAPTVKCS